MTADAGPLGSRFAALLKHDQTQLLVALVRRAVAEVVGDGDPAPVPEAATFGELGLDGPAVTRLRLRLTEETGVELPPAALSTARTVESAAGSIWYRLAGLPFDGSHVDSRGATGEWRTECLDLDGYLRRIGLPHRPRPTLDALRELHHAHSTAIGFDNIDRLLGRPVSYELGDIQLKVLRAGRGATCTELNLLLAAALERLGFAVTRLAGRPRIGGRVVLPLTHTALLVEVDGAAWLVDGGLGGEAVTEPVAIVGAAPAGRPPWRWRVTTAGDDGFVLQTERGPRWVDLYSFDLHPQRFVDYLVSYYYSTTYPGIPIATMLLAHRIAGGDRHVLRGTGYTVTTVDGTRTSRLLDLDGLGRVMAGVFGITLTEPELTTIWRGQTEAS
jgi:N-hydroxyarylamine O-acetyltransferase